MEDKYIAISEYEKLQRKLKEAEAEIDDWRKTARRLDGDNKELEAENKRLRGFAEYMVNHTIETNNAGVVLVNTLVKTIRIKAQQALDGKEPK